MTADIRSFPVGEADFASLIRSGTVYVDKTGGIADLLTSGTKVFLLLRPRRFGKTLTMSMLRCFLEMNYDLPGDRSAPESLFRDLKVAENHAICDQHMGAYPVISVTFRNVDGQDFPAATARLVNEFTAQAEKFRFLKNLPGADPGSTLFLDQMIAFGNNKAPMFRPDGSLTPDAFSLLTCFLQKLTGLLHRIFRRQAVLIIDEYDVPLQKAQVGGYYNRMLELVRGIHSEALKDNGDLFKAFVTGCLRISYQSIFTGANNLDCFGIQDVPHSRLIGFTVDEVAELLKKCGMSGRLEDLKRWYDGYNFGGTRMMCPWSVMKFLSRACSPGNDPQRFMPENYWSGTSGNDIIEICMKHPDPQDSERLQNLVDGGTETISAWEFTSYPEISSSTDFNVFALMMLHTGYLTCASKADLPESSPGPNSERALTEDPIRNSTGQQDPDPLQAQIPEQGRNPDRNNVQDQINIPKTGEQEQEKNIQLTVRIPNEEVRSCFRQKAELLFSRTNPVWVQQARKLTGALFSGDATQSREIINLMLKSFISVRDTAHYESYYHGFLTGVLSLTMTGSDTELRSNRESGDGYADIIMLDNRDGIAVILEFKKSTGPTLSAKRSICRKALAQIEKKQYDTGLNREDYPVVRKFGMAFWGKSCEVILGDDSSQDQRV